MIEKKGRGMTEDEKLRLNLSERLLKLVLNEKIPFEKKIGNMDYLIRLGADVNADLGCNSMLVYAQELGDEELVKYLKEKGGVEFRISKEKSYELGKQFWDESGAVKSVDEIKKLVLMGADLSVKNHNDEQIWKNLSLEEMNEILKDLPKGYVIDGDVVLSSRRLTELPDFSKIKVGGSFFCCSNKLTTLQGSPSEVGEDFYCNHNKLITLQGGPSVVGGNFRCNVNQLTSLQGAPEKVGGNFLCNHNKLITLQGASSEVGGDFRCGVNLLTSLQGAPEKVGGDFLCIINKLTTLDGKPKKIGGEFVIEKGVLARLEKKSIKNIWREMFSGNEGM